MDPEVSNTGSDRCGSDPGTSSTAPASARARDRGDQRKSGRGSRAHVRRVPSDAEYQQDNAMVQRDQLASDAKGICASKATILGASFLGSRISGGEQRQPDR